MGKRDFNLPVGTSLKLEPCIDNPPCGYTANLIGYIEDKSLLVTIPHCDGMPFSPAESEEYVVRYGEGESSYAFKTKVIRICAEPYPYVHLTYPEGVQGVMVRAAPRIPVNRVPVFMLAAGDGNKKYSVAMVDISVAGARLVSFDRLGQCGDRFSIEMMSPNDSGKKITFPVVIRYIREEDSKGASKNKNYHHGVEFLTLSHNAETFIQEFVTNQIASNRCG